MSCCRCQQATAYVRWTATPCDPDTGQLNVLNAGLGVARQERFTSRFSNESDWASCATSQDHYRRHACHLSPNSTCCVTSRTTCRACRDVLVALVLRSRRAARQARYSKSWLFLCRNSCARQSVVSWCDVPSGIWALAYKARGRIVAAVFCLASSAMSMTLQLSETMWHHPTTTSLLHRTTSGGSWNFWRGGRHPRRNLSQMQTRTCMSFIRGKGALLKKILTPILRWGRPPPNPRWICHCTQLNCCN